MRRFRSSLLILAVIGCGGSGGGRGGDTPAPGVDLGYVKTQPATKLCGSCAGMYVTTEPPDVPPSDEPDWIECGE